MLPYAQVQEKPRILQSLTKLSSKEFEALLLGFEQAWQEYIQLYFIDQAHDGVIGLSRSFIAAGVMSVIVSLREVPDLDSAKFFS